MGRAWGPCVTRGGLPQAGVNSRERDGSLADTALNVAYQNGHGARAQQLVSTGGQTSSAPSLVSPMPSGASTVTVARIACCRGAGSGENCGLGSRRF